MDLVADRDKATVEVQSLLLEVDVGPLEADYLVAAHPGHRGEPEQREQPMPSGRAQELAQLFVGQ